MMTATTTTAVMFIDCLDDFFRHLLSNNCQFHSVGNAGRYVYDSNGIGAGGATVECNCITQSGRRVRQRKRKCLLKYTNCCSSQEFDVSKEKNVMMPSMKLYEWMEWLAGINKDVYIIFPLHLFHPHLFYAHLSSKSSSFFLQEVVIWEHGKLGDWLNVERVNSFLFFITFFKRSLVGGDDSEDDVVYVVGVEALSMLLLFMVFKFV